MTARASTPQRSGTPRWTLIATILGSSLAFVDSTIVNVAIPAIAHDLKSGATGAQWTIAAYLLPLAAFVLVGGALGDRFGHRRIFQIGVPAFAAASMVCGAAPSMAILLLGRALQGLSAALFVPASLALLGTAFHGDARGRAIGTWSAFGSVASAIGPLVGGWLVDSWSWRFAFFVNLPAAAVTVAITWWRVEEAGKREQHPVDVAGGAAAVVALGALTSALTLTHGHRGWLIGLLVVSAVALAGFLAIERRTEAPMVPLDVWQSRLFSSINGLTFLIYAAMSIFTFILPIRLIVGGGRSATMAAAALLPFVAELFLLSRWTGQWASNRGPKIPLTSGGLLVGAGFIVLALDHGEGYWTGYFPGIVVLGLGMALTVAPLTTAVMSALGEARAGLASGINNAVARTAGLTGVSAVALIAGASTDQELARGFPRVMLAAAIVAFIGAAVAALLVENRRLDTDGSAQRSGRPVC